MLLNQVRHIDDEDFVLDAEENFVLDAELMRLLEHLNEVYVSFHDAI